MDHRARSFGSLGGRIILLGDGTELSSSEADTEMFEDHDEDEDLDQQVHKGSGAASESDDDAGADEFRNQREGTPAPSGPTEPEKVTSIPTTESPSSVTTEKSEVFESKEKPEDSVVAPASSQGAETKSSDTAPKQE